MPYNQHSFIKYLLNLSVCKDWEQQKIKTRYSSKGSWGPCDLAIILKPPIPIQSVWSYLDPWPVVLIILVQRITTFCNQNAQFTEDLLASNQLLDANPVNMVGMAWIISVMNLRSFYLSHLPWNLSILTITHSNSAKMDKMDHHLVTKTHPNPWHKYR
jgi:hypothetical protein